MNYENLPTRVKQASDGEKAKLCWCSGRVAVHYDEAAIYRIECENCGADGRKEKCFEYLNGDQYWCGKCHHVAEIPFDT